MSKKQLNEANATASRHILYLTGGVAALTAVILFRRNFNAELMISNGFGWFDLFQNDWLVGLMLFNLIDMINYLLVGLVFLTLYGVLKQKRHGLIAGTQERLLVAAEALLAIDNPGLLYEGFGYL